MASIAPKVRSQLAPEQFFADQPLGVLVFRDVEAALRGFEDVQVRTTKSQVAFRRRRGFAFIWLPGQYLRNAGADVVLSIALGHRDASTRFKEVVHPTTKHWIHHLEVNDVTDIYDQVVSWIREAAERAG